MGLEKERLLVVHEEEAGAINYTNAPGKNSSC